MFVHNFHNFLLECLNSVVFHKAEKIAFMKENGWFFTLTSYDKINEEGKKSSGIYNLTILN